MCINPQKNYDPAEAFFAQKYDKPDKLIHQLCDVNSHFYAIIKPKAIAIYESTILHNGIKPDPLFELDELYMLAVDDTARQVGKNKKGWLKNFQNENIYECINIARGRVVSNIRNLFDIKRKGNILGNIKAIQDLAADDFFAQKNRENKQNNTINDLARLIANEQSLVLKHLEELIHSFDITLSEAEELSKNIGLDYSLLNIKSNLNSDIGNDDGQLFWDFGDAK